MSVIFFNNEPVLLLLSGKKILKMIKLQNSLGRDWSGCLGAAEEPLPAWDGGDCTPNRHAGRGSWALELV